MLSISVNIAGLAIFTCILLIATAFYNAFILFKYPDYEKSVRIVDLGE